jgi:3-hydroxyacyl-[acyl-carrier-protein] dehydratase
MSGQTASRETGRGGRWTTLDRIVAIEPGRSATAVRNVTNTLAIFDSHFPRFPVLPGVLILGSLGELAGALLEQDGPEGWRLAGADRVGFRHFVRPGDELELTVELQKRDETEATLSGEAKVDGKVVTRARRLRLVRTGDE